MSLTDAAVRTAKPKEKNYKLSDGKGLYLEVATTGSKYWRMKFRFAGKENRLAIGVYPDISLKEAREKAFEARKELDKGINPNVKRRAQKMAVYESTGNTFEVLAHEWFSTRMLDKSDSHQVRTQRIIQNDLLPSLANRPIKDISAPELLATLRKIESRGTLETARRALQIASQIFRYAIVTARADRDPSPDLKGALKQPKKNHFAAITDPTEVRELMRAIEHFSGTPIVRAALQLSALLFQRPGEIRQMQWSQLNFETCEWRYLVSKTQTDHIVPLSNQAVAILQGLKPITGRSQYVFPSARGASRPMSDNAVRIALRSMGFDKETITAHGFRAMARTILDEVLNFRVDWIEHQLAHSVRDANGRAYNRTAHLEGRKKMMQEWANYLEKLKA